MFSGLLNVVGACLLSFGAGAGTNECLDRLLDRDNSPSTYSLTLVNDTYDEDDDYSTLLFGEDSDSFDGLNSSDFVSFYNEIYSDLPYTISFPAVGLDDYVTFTNDGYYDAVISYLKIADDGIYLLDSDDSALVEIGWDAPTQSFHGSQGEYFSLFINSLTLSDLSYDDYLILSSLFNIFVQGGNAMADIITALTTVGTSIATWFVNLFSSLTSIFYDTNGFTVMGTFLLVGISLFIISLVVNWITGLIRVR